MAAKRNHRVGFFARHLGRWRRMSGKRKHYRLVRAARVVCILSIMIGGGYGLLRLRAMVLLSPWYSGPANIELVDVPDGLDAELAASLSCFADVPWSSSSLVGDIAATLETVPWVKRVVQVSRHPDRRIEVRCVYRDATAMVQSSGAFFLVDEDCVRLPGRYGYHPSMKLIQGVSNAPPEPGCVWNAPDLRAGLDVVRLLLDEEFASQITAVLVQNHLGRADRRAAHIELATDITGCRILWGSAPGKELEENTSDQKIAILRANYDRYGHVSADRAVIDISVLPDRVHSPA